MPRVNQLAVWLGDQKVAVLRRTGPGGLSCEYTRQTLAEHPLGIPMLSCSLPMRRGRQAAWPFVTGLLPEGHHRLSMSRLAGVDTLDALGMLARFGRDVAGALVIAADPSNASDAGGCNSWSHGATWRHMVLFVNLKEGAGTQGGLLRRGAEVVPRRKTAGSCPQGWWPRPGRRRHREGRRLDRSDRGLRAGVVR
ncbi:MAG: serine/threonine-protein kinase HipA [Actinomycetota bacterium]|nr:serine/threonine-protein kinase HipA [Actinomycetota bacterium]